MSADEYRSRPDLDRLAEAEQRLHALRARVGADAQAAGILAWYRDVPRRTAALRAVAAAQAELDEEAERVGRDRAQRELGRLRLERGYRSTRASRSWP